MSYEYSSESKRLDFPNPHSVENYFLFAASAILLAGAIGLVVLGRGDISSRATDSALAPVLVGVFLLYPGIKYAIRALSQLRFFFGRERPYGLVQQLAGSATGKGKDADALKETIRQNALSVKEPTGPLNGPLYSLIPDLIFAPSRIQTLAQRQFQNGLAMLTTLLSAVVAFLGVSDRNSAAWLGLFYTVFSWFLLVKPVTTPETRGTMGEAKVGMGGLIMLILTAILGPVVVPLLTAGTPVPRWLSFNSATTIPVLVAALGAVTLFFAALTKQIGKRPQTTMACKQVSLSMNGHPQQLFDELERELQKGWVESVPNRRYVKVLPDVALNQETGAFTGEMVEETQPLPREDLRKLGLADAFSEPRFRWLAWLNVLGLVLVAGAVACLALFARELNISSFNETSTVYVTLGLSILFVGRLCFEAGNFLWGRFDFVSDFVWVEMSGTYQASRIGYGNQFTDRMQSQKQIINIENMTLRVWMARLDTVCFGKESGRGLVGMSGLHAEAKRLQEHLVAFAADQSVIVAPTSNADLHKVAAMGAINKLGDPSARPILAPDSMRQMVNQVANPGPASEAQKPAAPAGGVFCTNCGTPANAGARFCSGCGQGIVAPSNV